MNDTLAAVLQKGVPVFDGLFDLLEDLEAANIATAVASNGPMAKMQASLRPSGLWERFDGRIYSGHVFAPKPAPDMLLAACEAAGVAPRHTVMVGDTSYDMDMARNAGCLALGVSWGYHDAARLSAAHLMVDDIRLLPGLLDQIWRQMT